MINRRTVISSVLAVVVLFGSAACTAGQADPTIKSSNGVTDVTVTLPPIVDTTPLYLAIEKGYFANHGLNVKLATTPSMSAAIPAVVAGTSQFGALGAVDVMQASAAGIPIRIVGNVTTTTDKPAEDPGKVYVTKDGTVKTPSDLVGKTVAVSGLGGAGEFALKAALDKLGVDSSKVKFLEVPLDSMLDALQRGRVDAISSISPFTNQAEQAGAVYLMSSGSLAVPNAPQVVLTASASLTESNPKLVQDFRAAVDEATTYAAGHPEDVRAALPKFSGVPEDLAKIMQLPVFSPKLTADRARIWSDLLTNDKFVTGPIDLDTLLVLPTS